VRAWGDGSERNPYFRYINRNKKGITLDYKQPEGKALFLRLVECSLLETAIGFSSRTSVQWLADHEEPTRQGSRHRQNLPHQRMKTKDGYLMIGAAGQSIW